VITLGTITMVAGPFSRSTAGLGVSLLAVAAVTGLIYALRDVMPVEAAGVLYLLPVLLASTYWGLSVGIAVSVVSTLAFNFFHIPPTGEFRIANEENWVALAVFFAVAGVTSTLAGAARGRAEEAERDRREADLTAEMARVLLGGESLEESLPVVGQRIAAALGLPWAEVEDRWSDSDERRRALPVVVSGERAGTVAIPRDTPPATVELLERRLIPGLETLLTAARERSELEAQLIETRALRRSNVVKTALLRSVSHDLRSPLTAITAAAGGLASPTLDESARAELVAVIEEESQRLTRLVDNLLDLSRLQAGELEPRTDWSSAPELVEAVVSSVTPPPGGFEVSVEPELGMFEADSAQLERALANLVENAVRHAGSEPVRITVQRIGPSLAIRVSDHGPGISRAELDRIFEPFHAPGEHGGTGLGLAIARGFVEANGGELRAQSLPGQGSTFTILMPVAEAAAAGTDPQAPAPA
jgi:two-component system sensor histidine kinase KdpD